MKKTLIKQSYIKIIFLLLLVLPLIYYLYNRFVVDTNDKNSVQTVLENNSMEENSREESEINGDISGSSSRNAINKTFNQAKKWADDAQLFSCSGKPLEGNASDSSKFIPSMYTWSCVYYSSNLAKTRVYKYSGDDVIAQDPQDVLDCVKYIYEQVDYPDNYEAILDSEEIYQKAVVKGLNEKSTVNYYLRNMPDYGYVWRVDERAKSISALSDGGPLRKIYIFDIFSGDIIDTTTEEISFI